MKLSSLVVSVSLGLVVRSLLLVIPDRISQIPPRLSTDDQQQPLMDPIGPAIPPDEKPSRPAFPGGPGQGSVILSDVMSRDRSINIFAGFTRDIETVSQRLDDTNRNSTVLAPLNSAIEKLPRKPWEDPKDYSALGSNAYEGDDGQSRAHKNLCRFVEAHIVPLNPWPENKKIKALSEDGEIWWEEKDGLKLLQPGNIEIVNVASTVANGQVWIIRGVRNYAS